MAKPGKYAHVINTLPKLLGKDAARQDKINAIKDAIKREIPDIINNAAVAAKGYIALRVEQAEHDAAGSEISLRLEAHTQLMLDAFKSNDQSSAKIGEYGVSTYEEPYAQVEDKEALRLWCLANGYENRMALAWGTVNTITKERLLEGEAEPDGVTIYAKPKIRLSGLKGVVPDEE